MIERFFVQSKVLARLKSGPVGLYLPALGEELQQQGYSRDSIRRHLRAADAFGRWVVGQDLSIREITHATVDCYMAGLGRWFAVSYPQGRRPHQAVGLHHLIDVLEKQNLLGTVEATPSSGVEKWLTAFTQHLRSTAGNAPRTCDNYERYARRLCEACFGSAEPDWSQL